jgi:ribosomal protein L16 Arg81 hydroxylase
MIRPKFTFEDLVAPMTVEAFRSSVKGKKPIVLRGGNFKKNFFSNITTWKNISEYVANDRASSGLQVIKPDGEKLCMERNNLHSKPHPAWTGPHWYDKDMVSNIWSKGGSMILTKASMLSHNISAIASCLETEFAKSAADAHFYCSPRKNAVSFEAHADHDDNFLVHAIGSVHWKVYDVFARSEMREGRKTFISRMTMKDEEAGKYKTVIDTILHPGDLLYIPSGMFHKAVPETARVSISVPLQENTRQLPINRNYFDFEKNNS